MKTIEKCCKTCKHWDADFAKDKAGRIRRESVAKCNYELPALPESISNVPKIGWMAACYGKRCDCYEQRI